MTSEHSSEQPLLKAAADLQRTVCGVIGIAGDAAFVAFGCKSGGPN
jgi:hypothetical protein